MLKSFNSFHCWLWCYLVSSFCPWQKDFFFVVRWKCEIRGGWISIMYLSLDQTTQIQCYFTSIVPEICEQRGCLINISPSHRPFIAIMEYKYFSPMVVSISSKLGVVILVLASFIPKLVPSFYFIILKLSLYKFNSCIRVVNTYSTQPIKLVLDF